MTVDASEEKSSRKHYRKRRKCWLPAFSPFSKLFSTRSKINCTIRATMKLLSVNAFNFSQSEILLSVKAIETQKNQLCFQSTNPFDISITDSFSKPSEPLPKQTLVFMYLQYKSFENTVGKGEIACDDKFLLFPQCFLAVWKTFCNFHQT